VTKGGDESAVGRAIRLDLVIAVCALLISSLATAASWWQSHVVAQQLSAQVWPYLSFATTYDPGYVQVELVNDGLGPAIVRSSVLSIDGKPSPNAFAAFRQIFRPPSHGRMSVQLSGLSPGSVVRASSATRIFRIGAPWAARQFAAAANSGRVDFRACYCSRLGNCWTVSSRQQTDDPQPVAACAPPGAAQFRVPAGERL
jgi:hypothetical protein